MDMNLFLNANPVYKLHEKHGLICIRETNPDFIGIV